MKLKSLRQRLNLTQADLASSMKTTQQTIARWESGKTQLNVAQLRDLCLILHCSIEELIGRKIEVEEWRKTPFALSERETPYGTLTLNMTAGTRDYPVGEAARTSLFSQLSDRSAMNERSDPGAWLSSWTLSNKILLVNPKYLRSIQLLGDDVRAMPAYEHAEVYKAVADWNGERPSDLLEEAYLALIERLGGEDAAVREQLAIRIIHDDGSESWSLMTELVAGELLELEGAPFSIPSGSFLQLEEEGYDRAHFFNLDRIAMIEVPMDLYHRLSAPEEED